MAVRAMTSGSPWKELLRFSLPLLAGALLQQFYQTADTLIVGNFSGEKALSAVGTTNTLTFFFLAIALGFSSGNGVLVAHSFGAGNLEAVRKNAIGGISAALLLGVLCSIAGIVFSRVAYEKFVAVPSEILPETLLYFRIYCCGLVFQFLYNILAAALRSVGDSAASLYFLLLASVVNILLDLLLVAVLDYSVAGAAAATVFSQMLSMVAAWVYMQKKYSFFRCRIRDLKWDHAVAWETCKLGLPMSLQLVAVSLGLTFIQRAVNSFGQVMTASFTVGQRIEMYLHLPCNCLQTALTTYTGQNIGARQPQRISQGAWHGVGLSLAMTLVISGLCWCFADSLTGFFGLSSEAAAFCRSHLQAAALTNIILSLYVPLFGVFQGAKHTLIPTMVAVCALTLRVIITFAVKDGEFFGHTIIWWNSLFGYTTGCLITFSCFIGGLWKRNTFAEE